MTKHVTVLVPATSANLGPGFDVLGVALHLYNEVTFTIDLHGWTNHRPHIQVTVEAEGEGADDLPRDGTNLVFRAALKVFNAAKRWPKTLNIRLLNRIPLSRGMGSSSAAILGGMVAANHLLGKPLSDQELLDLAVNMEGHPDNIVPAFLGGFCISGVIKHKTHFLKFRAPLTLTAVVCSPDRPLATEQARRVLPSRVPFSAAVFTSSRTAFLLGAIVQRRFELLEFAMDDILHQPARSTLVPGLRDVIEAAKTAGAWGSALSGAGSSVIAFTQPGPTARHVARAMPLAFKARHIAAECRILALANKGIRVR